MEELIRRSKFSDIDAMTNIFNEARESIKALGINQWQNGYPHTDIITSDIQKGYSRVVEANGSVAATFALIDDGEPTYDKIYDGKWLTGDSKSYIAIHRVAILVSHRGSGISGRIIEYAARIANELGRASLRIDTHKGNVVMRKMLEKHGFTYCGVILLQDGEERVAYERLL